MSKRDTPDDVADMVRTEVVDGVGWLILNRPRAANAATPPMMRALCSAIDRFVEDPAVVAIAIRGEGRHFLAGGDIDWLAEIATGGESDAGGEVYRWFQGATRRLFNCRKPTVAAVFGGAITVGCEIALACDLRIVERRAFFQESWLDIGLIAPLGGAILLPRLIGLGKAKEMLLDCRRVGADEAFIIGLASEVVDGQETLHRRAQERARAMAARSRGAFAIAKDLIHAGLECSMAAGWEAGAAAQSELLNGPDFRAAVRALRADAGA